MLDICGCGCVCVCAWLSETLYYCRSVDHMGRFWGRRETGFMWWGAGGFLFCLQILGQTCPPPFPPPQTKFSGRFGVWLYTEIYYTLPLFLGRRWIETQSRARYIKNGKNWGPKKPPQKEEKKYRSIHFLGPCLFISFLYFFFFWPHPHSDTYTHTHTCIPIHEYSKTVHSMGPVPYVRQLIEWTEPGPCMYSTRNQVNGTRGPSTRQNDWDLGGLLNQNIHVPLHRQIPTTCVFFSHLPTLALTHQQQNKFQNCVNSRWLS